MTIQDHLLALEARTATITIQYGDESRTVVYTPSIAPWRRMTEIDSIEAEVGDHLFRMVCEKGSTNLPVTVDSDRVMP